MLKGLLSSFKANKLTLEMTEGENQNTFDKTSLNMRSQPQGLGVEGHGHEQEVGEAGNSSDLPLRRNSRQGFRQFFPPGPGGGLLGEGDGQRYNNDNSNNYNNNCNRQEVRKGELDALEKATSKLASMGVQLLQIQRNPAKKFQEGLKQQQQQQLEGEDDT
ncbi:unnamed protein product [Polarella glacialis]|uniref:Uncharacterized protein n=1 Tax=Polarella glacialis TaxID=89957 RepID=A0A813G675_POLGL|nr:unnamed protein product [Polarella glacialis]